MDRPSRLDGVRMSVGTLTAIPVRAPSRVDRRVARQAMMLATLVVAPLAAAAGALVYIGQCIGLLPLLSAVLAVGFMAMTTRGLHLDGLADTADGLAASHDRERALEVMRRGDVGPMGAATLVLVLLGQVAALAGAAANGHGALAIIVGVLTGRVTLSLCCARGIASAREDGLGAAVAGSVARWQVAALVTVFTILAGAAAWWTNLPWWQGILGVLIGLTAAAALLARCVQRLGGITGDVLGACVEIATLAALVTLSV